MSVAMKGGTRRRPKSLERKLCARPECGKTFVPTAHNQKYCDKDCCKKATNKKLLEKYYEKKKPIKPGRVCNTRGCRVILSVYNPKLQCNTCQQKEWEKIYKGA